MIKLHKNNYVGHGLDVHKIVFPSITLIVVLFILITLFSPETAGSAFVDLRLWLTSKFDWVFLITANVLLIFCLLVVLTPAGKIKLGGVDDKPEFSRLSWFAMLFAAGLG
ncbi:MAG: hypothetical protein CMO99_05650, partial [Woeseiaceae bacterium]|nr:hypothetical protein [Woeseiaceae bacterium]